MKDFLKGMEAQEIHDSTYPFYNMEVGDVFIYDYTPYIRIDEKDLYHKQLRFSYNAVSMVNGACVTFPNDAKVIMIENPCK